MQCFYFSIKKENYFIPLTQVLEASKYIEVTPIPMPSPGIRGVCNIRGKIYPVLDLHQLHTNQPNNSQKILMLCSLEKWSPALIVDEVHGIVDITDQSERVKLGEYNVVKVGDAAGVLLDLNLIKTTPLEGSISPEELMNSSAA